MGVMWEFLLISMISFLQDDSMLGAVPAANYDNA